MWLVRLLEQMCIRDSTGVTQDAFTAYCKVSGTKPVARVEYLSLIHILVNNTYEPQKTTVYSGDTSSFELEMTTNEIKWYMI